MEQARGGVLMVPNPEGRSAAEVQGKIAWDVIVRNTMIMRESLRQFFPDADLTTMVAEAREMARQVRMGDRTHFEATLCMQGAVLQAEASALSRRANELLMSNPDLALEMYKVEVSMRIAYTKTVNCLGRLDIQTTRAGRRARRVGG